jgi:ankyrin repeat protein
MNTSIICSSLKYIHKYKFISKVCNWIYQELSYVNYNDLKLQKAFRFNDFEIIRIIIHFVNDTIILDNYLSKCITFRYDKIPYDIIELVILNGASFTDKNKDQALLWSSNNGYYEITEFLINNDADLNDNEALHLACINNHIDVAELIINKSKHIKGTYTDVLIDVCKEGHYEMAEFLITNCKNRIRSFHNALKISIYMKYQNIVDLLISNGADISKIKSENLLECIKRKDFKKVKNLLLEGVKPKAGCLAQALVTDSYRPMTIYGRKDEYIVKENQLEIIKLLIINGANVHEKDNETLIRMCKIGNIEIVKLLIKKKANVQARDNLALTRAAGYGHCEIVKLLLSKGALINDEAFKYACMFKHYEVIKLLIDNGVDTNEHLLMNIIDNYDMVEYLINKGIDITNDEILIKACHNGDYNIIKLLIDNGANKDIKTTVHKQTLIKAVEEYDYKIVKLLINIGADVNYNDDKALRIACNNGYLKIAKELIKSGANVNTLNGFCLINACKDGNRNMAELLIRNGANVHVKNDLPLRHAKKNGHKNIIDLFEI